MKNKPDKHMDGADPLTAVTECLVFRSPNFDKIKNKLSTPVTFDGRNMYDPIQMEAIGIEYFEMVRSKSCN